MPEADDILTGLHSISNTYYWVATLWHVFFYALLIALAANWRPANGVLATLLSAPILSVSVFAWLSGNPFNGSVFLIAALLMLFFGLKASRQRVTVSPWPFALGGIVMVLFGLVYPHFLEANNVFRYLYASPFGLIPCPTLSVLIGLALLFNSFESGRITVLLIVMGLFYGIIGVIKLNVHLDATLIAGTLLLSISGILYIKRPAA